MAEFQFVPLGEVASVRSGYAFKSSDWRNFGTPVVKIANVKSGRLNMDGCSFVAEDVARDAREFQLALGDILIAMTGYIGEIAVVRETDIPALLNQRVGRFSIRDTQRLDRQFLYYVVTAPSIRQEIEGLGYGSAQPNVSPSLIQSVKIPLPPIGYQQAIASVLGALDDKIDLNRRMNETLEAMAQAIFRDWFVDFGPVRRKMAGATDPVAIMGGLTPDLTRATELAALFPDALDVDDLPAGWSASTVGDAFNLTMGQSPPGETYNDTGKGLPFFQGRTDFGFRFPVRRKFCSQPTRIANPDDTLISVRAPVGDLNMAWEKCCIGRGVAAARHKAGGKTYTYYAMRHLQPQLEQFESEGTVFGAINKKQFEQLPIVEPHARLVDTYEVIAGALDDRLRVAVTESRTLAETRDYLLPRLMSGEVRVGDAALEIAA